MKYLIKIALGLFVYMVAIAACKDDDDSGIAGFAIDKEDITMGADGGTDVVTVSSGGEWTASSSEPWVSISPASGSGVTECAIAIDYPHKRNAHGRNSLYSPWTGSGCDDRTSNGIW